MARPWIIDKIDDLFRRRGASLYGGEAVTQLEHGLQAATMAEDSGAPATLVTAALLHDVGHLLHNLPDDAAADGIDDVHEQLGDRWLKQHFPPAVSEPVRLHVEAKRYLCAVDEGYFATLSPASVQSLALQGGPFSADEVAQFERNPHFREAVELRRWDDLAKVVDLETPELAHFLPIIEDALQTDANIGTLL